MLSETKFKEDESAGFHKNNLEDINDLFGVTPGMTETPIDFHDMYKLRLFAGAAHLIWGSRSAGKSFFVFDTVIGYLEHCDRVGEEAHPVIYIDGDSTGSTRKVFENRYEKFLKNKLFKYWASSANPYLPIRLYNCVTDPRKPILIFDSFKDFTCGIDMKDTKDVNDYCVLLKQLLEKYTALYVIAHATAQRVDGKVTGYKLQGNQGAFEQSFNFVFEAVKKDEYVVRKSRNVSLREDTVLHITSLTKAFKYNNTPLSDVKRNLNLYKIGSKYDLDEFMSGEGVWWECVKVDGIGHFKII